MEGKSAFSSGRRHGISQLPKEHINVAEKIIRGTSGLGAADGGQRTANGFTHRMRWVQRTAGSGQRTANGCDGESGELHKNVAGRNTEQLSAGLRKRWWTTGAWSAQREALKEKRNERGRVVQRDGGGGYSGVDGGGKWGGVSLGGSGSRGRGCGMWGSRGKTRQQDKRERDGRAVKLWLWVLRGGRRGGMAGVRCDVVCACG